MHDQDSDSKEKRIQIKEVTAGGLAIWVCLWFNNMWDPNIWLPLSCIIYLLDDNFITYKIT